MSKVRIGIVGAGQRVCNHGGCVFRNCGRALQVAALCDVHSGRLSEAKRKYEQQFGYEIGTYADYVEMYEQAQLDGVYIAAPNYLHKDIAVAAFEHGLHVLCEKPLSVTLADCDAMIAASQKAGKVFGAAMQMHYRKRYHKVRELIDEGLVGHPAMLWCTEYRGPFPKAMSWVHRTEKSGGALVEKNCHHYDILNLWAQSDPTTVYASGNTLKHKVMGGERSEIIDNAWVVSDYASGARAMVGICFLGRDKSHRREFGVQGTEGKVWFSSEDSEVIHFESTSGETEDFTINEDLRGGVFKDFVECMQTGKQPLVTPEMARRSLLVPLAAERSMREKRIVDVAELA